MACISGDDAERTWRTRRPHIAPRCHSPNA